MKRLIAIIVMFSMLMSATAGFQTVNADSEFEDRCPLLSIKDALEILKYLAKMESVYENTDVKPTMLDALDILKYLAKMVDRPILPLEREPVVIGCGECGVCEDCDPPAGSIAIVW